MRDYFKFDVKFVMNITDVDDKVYFISFPLVALFMSVAFVVCPFATADSVLLLLFV